MLELLGEEDHETIGDRLQFEVSARKIDLQLSAVTILPLGVKVVDGGQSTVSSVLSFEGIEVALIPLAPLAILSQLHLVSIEPEVKLAVDRATKIVKLSHEHTDTGTDFALLHPTKMVASYLGVGSGFLPYPGRSEATIPYNSSRFCSNFVTEFGSQEVVAKEKP